MVVRREKIGREKEPSCPGTVTAHANAGCHAGARVQRRKGSPGNDSRPTRRPPSPAENARWLLCCGVPLTERTQSPRRPLHGPEVLTVS